jgi:hypothetical protein
MRNVDAALLPFLYSTDESERDRLLGELILECVSPIVSQALRQRLNFYVDESGNNPNNPEAEDLPGNRSIAHDLSILSRSEALQQAQ